MFDQLGLSPPKPIQPFGLIKTSEYSLSKNGKLNPIDTGFGESSLLVNCICVPKFSISIQLKSKEVSADEFDQ